jgi:hypothetical protein
MATKLGDSRSIAYTTCMDLFASTTIAPVPIEIFEARSRDAIAAAAELNDDIQSTVRFIIGWMNFIVGG